jgi:hypothetical protein
MTPINFLALPGEIRNQIYEHLLVIPLHPSAQQDRSTTAPIHAQILAASHQIHREGSAILYGCNTFVSNESLLTSMPRLRAWYKPVTARHYLTLITRYHMHVRLDCDARFSAESATRAFSGLDELSIEVWQAQFESSDSEIMRLFEGVRRVKRATVFGSVTAFPAYRKWLEGAMMSPEGQLPSNRAEEAEEEEEETDARTHDLWEAG